MKMHARSPALAAWAATAPARFPVDAHASVSNPSSSALVAAIETGRSLREQVGLTVSFLIQTLRSPTARARLSARTSGVQPAWVSATRLPPMGSSALWRYD